MKTNVKVGDKIIILQMKGEKAYSGKTGFVESFDDEGYIHGTWGGCSIDPSLDYFIVDNQ